MARVKRLSTLAGALAGILWLAGILLLQSSNPATPTPEQLVEYFRDNRATTLAGGTLIGLGGFFFLWFVASISELVARIGDPWLARTTMLGGASGGVMMMALAGPHTTGATTDTNLLSPDTAVAFWRLGHTFFVAAEIGLAVFLASLAVAVLAGGMLPRSLGWSALVIAVLLLIVPIAWLALIFLVPLWLVATGGVLFRRGGMVDAR